MGYEAYLLRESGFPKKAGAMFAHHSQIKLIQTDLSIAIILKTSSVKMHQSLRYFEHDDCQLNKTRPLCYTASFARQPIYRLAETITATDRK
jgi:hypothetical protein